MKKLIIILLVLLSFSFQVSAQDIENVQEDFALFFEQLGNEVTPYLQYSTMLGSGLETAQMYNDSHFYISYSASSIFGDGFLQFIDGTTYEILDMNSLTGNLLQNVPQDIEDLYFSGTGLSPLPSMRLSFGMKLPHEFEAKITGAFLPQALIDVALGFAGDQVPDIELSNIVTGLRISRPLIIEDGLLPTVSLGAGYSFGKLHVGYPIVDFEQTIAGGSILSINGVIGIDTMVNTFGFDLGISKKFMVFAPYLHTYTYYQFSTFSGQIGNYRATISDSGGTLVSDSDNSDGVEPAADKTVINVSILLAGGVDMILGPVVLSPGVTYHPASNNLGASLTLRSQW